MSAEGVKPDPENINKIVTWPTPTSQSEVWTFLGMGNYYRSFIKNYSQKMQPLLTLTKRDVPFKWTANCQKAFDLLKQELMSAPILTHPQDRGQYILDTDGFKQAIGQVLSQVQDEQEMVIAYGSQTLSHQVRNYCATDVELLAPHFFMEYYHLYLLGRPFIVKSDHVALKWIFSLREPHDRIACWLEVMSAYQFIVEYQPGKKHGNADAMSHHKWQNPAYCQCAILEDNETLPCWPCKMCKR